MPVSRLLSINSPAVYLSPSCATTIGLVHASANKDFAVGDWVLGLNGIEEYSRVAPGGFTAKIDVAKVTSPTGTAATQSSRSEGRAAVTPLRTDWPRPRRA
jgi:NADPH-dependent curcumin reductase CurA